MWALVNDSWTQITVVVSIALIVIVGYLWHFVSGEMKHGKVEVEKDAHAFDGIIEGMNPTPMGLHLIMASLIAFGFFYVAIGFPIWSWTQEGQYDEEVMAYNQSFEERWKNADHDTMVAMGESIFNSKCAACHGITGEGQNGLAANLIEYGNVEHVSDVIRNGSKGLGYTMKQMPANDVILAVMYGEENLENNILDTAAYTVTLSGRTPNAGDPTRGKQMYEETCAVCHGVDGQGRGPTGMEVGYAKDLTKYGTVQDIVKTLHHGKKGYIGEMPSFVQEGTLSETHFLAVSTFVASELK
jgi:cytochrome c oxidase cbb3-type subunit 3